MKKEEVQVLGLKKSKEGKSYSEIKEELLRVDDYCKEVKSDKKLIERLYKRITETEKKLERKNKEIFNLKLKLDAKDPEKDSKNLSLNDLKKIMMLIKAEEGISKKEICETLYFNNKKINCGLTFLVRNKLIEDVSKHSQKYYK